MRAVAVPFILLDVAALSFFVGKGGVGKTTVSAAYAIRTAQTNVSDRVLIISTDPAHSLADVLQLSLADSRRRIKLGRGQLTAWQINPQRQFDKFLGEQRENILAVVEAGSIFTRKEIEPLLDTTLPGMAEVSALLAISDLLDSGEWDHIVVDTAPIGHTLRLFELPEHFARFLDFLETAASRDQVLAEHFARRRFAIKQPFLDEWQQMVKKIHQALAGPESRIVMVTTPETFALNESVRMADALAEAEGKFQISELVLNRAGLRANECVYCRSRVRETRSAMAFLKKNFSRTPVHVGEDSGAPVMGVAALAQFAEHVFAGKPLKVAVRAPKARDIRLEKARWPELETPLSFTLGKGGVGKTTVSAALAFHQRSHDRRLHGNSRLAARAQVTICSTDPAPSLDDVFQQEVGDQPKAVLGDPGFRAIEIDSVAHFRRWAVRMRDQLQEGLSGQSGGIHMDLTFESRVLSALLDIVPPGVDEIFAIFRILDLLSAKQVVVIDMAPTGHALELLRTPDRLLLWSRLLLKTLAPHRTLPLVQDAAVQIAEVSQRARELADLLRDGKRARLYPVMLAEPLPDRETARLLKSVKELGIAAGVLFVNRVILDEGKCRRCRLARTWQMATLASIRRAHRGLEVYVLPNFSREISGATGLKAFTRELWRMR